MCEVLLEVAPDPFHRWVEVTEFQIGELLASDGEEFFNAHAFAGFGDPDPSQIPIGVYIEIPPLYHAQPRIPDEFP